MNDADAKARRLARSQAKLGGFLKKCVSKMNQNLTENGIALPSDSAPPIVETLDEICDGVFISNAAVAEQSVLSEESSAPTGIDVVVVAARSLSPPDPAKGGSRVRPVVVLQHVAADQQESTESDLAEVLGRAAEEVRSILRRHRQKEPPNSPRPVCYIQLDLDDNPTQSLAALFLPMAGLIEALVGAPVEGQPVKVLVHCAMGVSRSVSVVAGWLLVSRRAATAEDAMTKIRAKRAQANPNAYFGLQLFKLQRRLCSGLADGASASSAPVEASAQ